MNKVFRAYFEKLFLTPTEILYNARELKRLRDKDSLLPAAVDRIAQLQVREGEGDAKARKDEIFKAIEQMDAKARKAEALKLPKLETTFSAMLAALPPTDSDWERDYLALTVVARELIGIRGFAGKLERLCKLAAGEEDAAALALLDGVIADLFATTVVQEILGWQPGLAHAICAMIDLAEGNLVADKSETADALDTLNRMFRERRLPNSRAALIDRAHRQLASTSPLFRTKPEEEKNAFLKVLQRLLLPTGLYSSPDTAEALTTRYTRMVQQGGTSGRRAAIDCVFRAMPDRAYGIMYLCDLARSDYAKEHADDMAEQLRAAISGKHIVDLVQRALSAKERMVRATNAHLAVSASTYPAETRKRVTDHIDRMLESYLVEEQIIEKLDHPDSSLRDRAVRLVQFCAAGVLPEGKSLTRARSRILALLRQPNFDAHFVDGISDPIKAQKALRDFHQLLIKAGFGG
jgi:hypothetical protein